ncbi:uncharacterized protein LOC117144807 isoform X2 [Drosophila mauritiana]|uniref:Uncharacterized protein LOC117144807 isoform X2 n=1 Tax=Drosophila mauritiana TaxID=7226 RepID=A0A6P8KQ89_DROMA|nr:uncharacterized protein LOC117144807 isoform X2 [Drosophila mauritiana]
MAVHHNLGSRSTHTASANKEAYILTEVANNKFVDIRCALTKQPKGRGRVQTWPRWSTHTANKLSGRPIATPGYQILHNSRGLFSISGTFKIQNALSTLSLSIGPR